MSDQHPADPALVSSTPPGIAGYSVTTFTIPVLALALVLGPPVLLGLQPQHQPWSAGTIYAAAVAAGALPLLWLCSFRVTMTLDPQRLTVERRFRWGRRIFSLPATAIERWYVLASVSMLVLRGRDGRVLRMVLHTPETSKRYGESVPLVTAWLDHTLGGLRDVDWEEPGSRRAHRVVVASVIAGVVLGGGGGALVLLALIG
ncbi:hypothetical protein IM660_12070 [Ruania alkalisoli]|uniref:PH domain-containing protein n=1 Tax=Ruania alkalisoli TaxID=2779775 RepID=A0A7M1SQJ0_9MICO|nr:hypothetical protein [Ruania alkalisoli]QOR69427.1 hypothetical protein IM660_12070 [Ruania alkalisoli]